jgi:hypothetical protein
MFHATRVTFHAARRIAAIGALATGIAGAAHASFDLDTPTLLLSGNGIEMVNAPEFGSAVLTLGESTIGSNVQIMRTGSGVATGSDTTYSGTSASAGSAGTESLGTSGAGFGNRDNHLAPPAATPEPITMGISIFGLGLAARRVRRRSN